MQNSITSPLKYGKMETKITQNNEFSLVKDAIKTRGIMTK